MDTHNGSREIKNKAFTAMPRAADRPHIIGFTDQTASSLIVTVYSPDREAATQWAMNYFGDSSLDYRNTNTVRYLDSDCNYHRYQVTAKEVK